MTENYESWTHEELLQECKRRGLLENKEGRNEHETKRRNNTQC